MPYAKNPREERCYRVGCDCLSPGFYSEFDNEADAEKHIREVHQGDKSDVVMAIVPVKRETCKHLRHSRESQEQYESADLDRAGVGREHNIEEPEKEEGE